MNICDYIIFYWFDNRYQKQKQIQEPGKQQFAIEDKTKHYYTRYETG